MLSRDGSRVKDLQAIVESLARPEVLGLTPYTAGRPIAEVERELGLTGAIKLASNENPLGPSPRAVEAMREALAEVHRYPEGGCPFLREALALQLDVQPACLVFGNGSNELLELLARAFLSSGDEAVMAEPTFLIYRKLCQAVGCGVRAVPLRDFVHDLEAMGRAVGPRTKLVFVSNPNNPTGTAVAPQAFEAFWDRISPEVIVVIDEAYREFLPPGLRPDPLAAIRAGRLVLTLRTFSKVYGLAGLRIGYGVGPAPLMAVLDRVRQPFNVNVLAQVAARAALADEAHVKATVRTNEEGRRTLQEAFTTRGFPFIPSVANFVLVRVGEGRTVSDALLRQGVIVRSMEAFGLPEWIRVSIGTSAENERFLKALSAVIAR